MTLHTDTGGFMLPYRSYQNNSPLFGVVDQCTVLSAVLLDVPPHDHARGLPALVRFLVLGGGEKPDDTHNGHPDKKQPTAAAPAAAKHAAQRGGGRGGVVD